MTAEERTEQLAALRQIVASVVFTRWEASSRSATIEGQKVRNEIRGDVRPSCRSNFGLGHVELARAAHTTAELDPDAQLASLNRIVGSDPFRRWAASSAGAAIDSSKVREEIRGNQKPTAGSGFARGLIRMARLAHAHHEPPPPPPPPPVRWPPRTHNRGAADQDPLFCTKDEYGCVDGWHPVYGKVRKGPAGEAYDDKGRDLDGVRVRDRMVPGLKGAEDTDGRGACDPYTHMGRSFPPYPEESFLQ